MCCLHQQSSELDLAKNQLSGASVQIYTLEVRGAGWAYELESCGRVTDLNWGGLEVYDWSINGSAAG